MRKQVWEVEILANCCLHSSTPYPDSNPWPILMLLRVHWSALSPYNGPLAFLLDICPSLQESSSRLHGTACSATLFTDDRHHVKLHPMLGDPDADYISANYIDVSA